MQRIARQGLKFSQMALAGLLLWGCGSEPERIAGERVPLRTVAPALVAQDVGPISLPAQTLNTRWIGGQIEGAVIGNPQLGVSITERWRTDIVKDRIAWPTADPIIIDGVIYTLNGASGLYALDLKSGEILWQRALNPKGEKGHEGFGGGLGYRDGVLYVTTGFGDVHAISAASGDQVWTYHLDAPIRSAPAVSASHVVAIDRSGSVVALDRGTGRQIWRFAGQSDIGVIGSAGPQIIDTAVYAPFPSGDLAAFDLRTGQRVWQAPLTRRRSGAALDTMTDLTVTPRIAAGQVITGASFGTLVKMNAGNGARAWSMDQGIMDDVLPLGGSIYFMDAHAGLTRIDAETGALIWRKQLPETMPGADEDAPPRLYYGPVLAGDRLWLAASDGQVYARDPESGAAIGGLRVAGGVAARPAAADGHLVFLTKEREVRAFQ